MSTTAAAPPAGSPRLRRPGRGPTVAAIVLGPLVALALLGADAGLHHVPLSGLLDSFFAALRVIAGACVLFGLTGFGLARLLLPERLRERELLWVLPIGACATALALTVLGYAFVPFYASLPLVMVAGAALSVYALRRRPGAPRGGGESAVALWAALTIAAVALVPYALAGFPTMTGPGSDSHQAAGTAELLRHAHPAGEDVGSPIDRVPILWRSKPPIYYALASTATLAGLETWEALPPTAAFLLGLAALGFYLVARELLGAPAWVALAALGVVGLDRMVLHTILTPYFNQTWGFFPLPFTLVLAWVAVKDRSPPVGALLALTLIVLGFAYPLALPIPLIAAAIFLGHDTLERRRRGEPTGLPRIYRGRRSLAVLIPLGLLLAIPALGVAEKAWTAAEVLVDPSVSLLPWAGDMLAFIPGWQFFALPGAFAWPVLLAVLLVLALLALRRLPRGMALGLGVTMALFLVAAVLFRVRDHGYYFEFKTLAFIAPLVLTCALAGAGRLKGPALVAPLVVGLIVVSAMASGRQEVTTTFWQITKPTAQLRDWDAALPPGRSVRLDMPPNVQIWAAYMLAGQPVCSQLPLLGTNYPYVQFSRKSDLILVTRKIERRQGPPLDSVGPPIRRNREYSLYRSRPDTPGPDRCSQMLVDPVKGV